MCKCVLCLLRVMGVFWNEVALSEFGNIVAWKVRLFGDKRRYSILVEVNPAITEKSCDVMYIGESME